MDYNPWLDIGSPLGKADGSQSLPNSIAASTFEDTPSSSCSNVASSHWQSSHSDEASSYLWRDDGTVYTLPDSWSQTLDSLYGSAVEIHDGSTHSSPDTNPSVSGDSTASFSSGASTSSASSAQPASCSASQSDSAHLLSLSPSHPFDLLPSPTHEKAPVAQPSSNIGVSLTKTVGNLGAGRNGIGREFAPPHAIADLVPHTPISYVASSSSRALPPFRLLFDYARSPGAPQPNPPIPQNNCVAPADLALNRVVIPSVQQSAMLGASIIHTMPNVPPMPMPIPQPPLVPRVLHGWKPASGGERSQVESHQPGVSLASKIIPGLKPPCPRPSAGRIPVVSHARTPPRPSIRRTRRKVTKRLAGDNPGSDEDRQEDDDSDIYQPSSSPSFSAADSRENSPYVGPYHSSSHAAFTVERHPRRGKGKAKGSAALALAVVTQMSNMQQQKNDTSNSSAGFLQNEDDALEMHLRATRPGGKRKNSTIPLPVPVPHLIKKSRGRKVPYAPQEGGSEGQINSSSSAASTLFAQSVFDEPFVGAAIAGPVRTARGVRGKRAATPYSLAEGGKRTYMCDVLGCGKCFVRGEHLKRHVRSIHTYDKPHPCPYTGCDKTFSRRDNLGQHVRIHLQV